MSDGTTVSPSNDKIDTEDLGGRGKVQRSKIALGALDADGGDVTDTNPFPAKLKFKYTTEAPTPAEGDYVDPRIGDFGEILMSLLIPLTALVGGQEAHNVGVAPFRRADSFNDGIIETADLTTAATVKSGVDSKSIYITDVTISTDTSGWIKLQDDNGTTVVPKKYFTTDGIWHKSYRSPKQVAVGIGLKAVAQNIGNVSIEVDGYII